MKANRLEGLVQTDMKVRKHRSSAEIFEGSQKNVGGIKLYAGEVTTAKRVSVPDVEGVYEKVRERCYFHYDTYFAGQGIGYEHYEPAYQFGAEIAASAQYGDMLWVDVVDQIKAQWEAVNPDTWEEYRIPIMHGWHLIHQLRLRKKVLEPA